MDHAATLSIDDVRQLLGVSRTTLWRWMARKQISYYRIGSKVRFGHHHIAEFLGSVERKAHGRPRRPHV